MRRRLQAVKAAMPYDVSSSGCCAARRRVPGLRREEVALLAGVGVDYYVRLERGHLAGACDEVLDAVDAPRPVNIARFQLLHPAGRDFFPDWEASLTTTASVLRTEAGRDPHASELTSQIGGLVTRSDEFRTAWAKHDVRPHHTGRNPFHHLEIGDLVLDLDAMALPAQPGLTLTAYSAAGVPPLGERVPDPATPT